jgi:hypothetical protein
MLEKYLKQCIFMGLVGCSGTAHLALRCPGFNPQYLQNAFLQEISAT